MYVTRVPNRGSPPAVLLRESYREHGKVKTRTLANLSRWPEHKVEKLQQALKGLPTTANLSEAFTITRSLPHGHVAAVLGSARRLGVEELIDPTPSRRRDLVTAMLVAQVIAPGSKLAFARGLRSQTATSSLGEVLGAACCDEDDLYAAMDWVLDRKEGIENALAARHLTNGTLVLYDVSSAAFEGRTCPLGAIGHARDGVKGRLQIVYGLLCSPKGVPVAIEVFEGNTADPKTLAAQIRKLKTRFGLTQIALVGDRGMLTSARIRDELRPAQLDWISALRAPQIKALIETDALQLSLFDQQNLFEITHPDYPGERLICCHNPALADDRARTRHELLAATEKELDKIAAADWTDFITAQFHKRGRAIVAPALESLLNAADLIPYDVQRIAHELWDYAELQNKKQLGIADVEAVVNALVSGQSTYYELLWEQLAPRQRAALQALAARGHAEIYSQTLREEFRLGPASTVQKAFQSLDAKDILDRYKGDYFFLDPLFPMWINKRAS